MCIRDRDKVDIRTYRVIYDAIEEIETAMKGMLAPKFRDVVMGLYLIHILCRSAGMQDYR